MMKTKKALIYSMLMLLPGSLLFGTSKKTQQFELRVIRGNETIGQIRTSEVTYNNTVAYFLYSNVQVNLVMKVNIEESISDVFEGNELTHSVQARHINGKVKSSNTLKKGTSGYELNSLEHLTTLPDEVITCSVLSLYYNEPSDGDRVYSQSLKKMLLVQKTGPGKYRLELPNGNITTYVYDKGLLQSVESQTTWGTILFERA